MNHRLSIGMSLLVAMASSSGSAQTVKLDPNAAPTMFRHAVLGWCIEQVFGKSIVAHKLNPGDDTDWVALRSDAQTTGGQILFAGRVSRSTGVIVDLSTSRQSCFVQLNLPGSASAVAQKLRTEITELPGATLLKEESTAEGHVTYYGLVSPDSTRVPLLMVADNPKDPTVTTAIVQVGQKGTS